MFQAAGKNFVFKKEEIIDILFSLNIFILDGQDLVLNTMNNT